MADGPSSLPGADVDAADGTFLDALDRRLAAAARRAGPHLACGVGCTDCCVGPFPINPLDARRLRRGLAALERADPPRAAVLVERLDEAVAVLAEGFPGSLTDGVLGPDEVAVERFLARHRRLPCPVLDSASGRCELYLHRPVSCRTYGPPVEIGGRPLPPCSLCFRAADEATVERCRLDPDPEGLEDRVLDQLERRGASGGETLVAFALARRDADDA